MGSKKRNNNNTFESFSLQWSIWLPKFSLKSFLSLDDRLKIAQLFLFDSLRRVLPLVTELAGELPSPPRLLLSDDLSSDEDL